MSNGIKIHGSLFHAFLNAGHSLKLLLNGNVEHLQFYEQDQWYEFEEFVELLGLTSKYTNSGRILEQLGMEMMKSWFQNGSETPRIASSLEFLELQRDSLGFFSVVEGPREATGSFALQGLDNDAGKARVLSSTVFPRELERGILMGGLALAGDLLYFEVDNSLDADVFEILFVHRENRYSLSWHHGNHFDEMEWRLEHHKKMTREKDQFWLSINETLNIAYAEILKLATLDPLTGAYNRRELYRLGEIELNKSKRGGIPLSVLYLDLDHFKKINDTHGHEAGDKALSSFVELCRSECRQYDLIGRLGGEEFCILLPLTDLESALALGKRILDRTRDLTVDLPRAKLKFTVSIGIAAHDGQEGINDLIYRADRELLLAKKLGRNRISKQCALARSSLKSLRMP